MSPRTWPGAGPTPPPPPPSQWLAGVAGRLIAGGRYPAARSLLATIEARGGPIDPHTGTEVDVALQARVAVALVGDSSLIPHRSKGLNRHDFVPADALRAAATVATFGLQGQPLSQRSLEVKEFVLGCGTSTTMLPLVQQAGQWFDSVCGSKDLANAPTYASSFSTPQGLPADPWSAKNWTGGGSSTDPPPSQS